MRSMMMIHRPESSLFLSPSRQYSPILVLISVVRARLGKRGEGEQVVRSEGREIRVEGDSRVSLTSCSSVPTIRATISSSFILSRVGTARRGRGREEERERDEQERFAQLRHARTSLSLQVPTHGAPLDRTSERSEGNTAIAQ